MYPPRKVLPPPDVKALPDNCPIHVFLEPELLSESALYPTAVFSPAVVIASPVSAPTKVFLVPVVDSFP